MIGDRGGEEDEGWQDVGVAPIGVERGQSMGGADPNVVTTSDGDSVQVPRGVPEPKTPAPDIVARHNLTHLPYAAWCPHCVAARRANNPHFQREEIFRRMIPLLVLGYCLSAMLRTKTFSCCWSGVCTHPVSRSPFLWI